MRRSLVILIMLGPLLVGCASSKHRWSRSDDQRFTSRAFFEAAYACKRDNAYVGETSGAISTGVVTADTAVDTSVAFSRTYVTYSEELFLNCMRGLGWAVTEAP